MDEFINVFPDELPGLPLSKEVEFIIDLLSGTLAISIPSYHMTLAELVELKIQLEELLKPGFIHPSVSLWDLE